VRSNSMHPEHPLLLTIYNTICVETLKAQLAISRLDDDELRVSHLDVQIAQRVELMLSTDPKYASLGGTPTHISVRWLACSLPSLSLSLFSSLSLFLSRSLRLILGTYTPLPSRSHSFSSSHPWYIHSPALSLSLVLFVSSLVHTLPCPLPLARSLRLILGTYAFLPSRSRSFSLIHHVVSHVGTGAHFEEQVLCLARPFAVSS
jgi:hypothetical protein